jgi:hypothetical protein
VRHGVVRLPSARYEVILVSPVPGGRLRGRHRTLATSS